MSAIETLLVELRDQGQLAAFAAHVFRCAMESDKRLKDARGCWRARKTAAFGVSAFSIDASFHLSVQDGDLRLLNAFLGEVSRGERFLANETAHISDIVIIGVMDMPVGSAVIGIMSRGEVLVQLMKNRVGHVMASPDGYGHAHMAHVETWEGGKLVLQNNRLSAVFMQSASASSLEDKAWLFDAPLTLAVRQWSSDLLALGISARGNLEDLTFSLCAQTADRRLDPPGLDGCLPFGVQLVETESGRVLASRTVFMDPAFTATIMTMLEEQAERPIIDVQALANMVRAYEIDYPVPGSAFRSADTTVCTVR